ncbi:PKD domain-containing protein [Modestobacter italicus]|uniref:PKD domain-containing protein n=1 Tax=Modestobacter italicus (strain DSM 44449 / CECT 9708 / BC 501) TaxID=2732864 RepID=UPI001C93BCF5|nr:PKD domain-containing protein [Modestobacter italicus]
MTQERTGTAPQDRTLVCAGTLLSLLVVLVAIAGGLPTAVGVLGAVVASVGAVALVRGQAHRLHVVGRPAGAVVLGVGAVTLGAAVVLAAGTPGAGADPALDAAPATPQAQQVAPVAAAPALAITCPGGWGASPLFGHDVTATAPYSVTIDYGDGDVYTHDDQHLSAVFSHTYATPGSFEVTAVVTDATGQTATGSCTYRW